MSDTASGASEEPGEFRARGAGTPPHAPDARTGGDPEATPGRPQEHPRARARAPQHQRGGSVPTRTMCRSEDQTYEESLSLYQTRLPSTFCPLSLQAIPTTAP